MADAVTTEWLFSGNKRKILHCTCISDGTGESLVTKVDISTLTFMGARVPTFSTIDMIDFAIQGFTSVRLFWDHTTDDEIAILPVGVGTIQWGAIGGKHDPRTAGGTGDVLLTSVGAVAGATYDLTIYLRPKGGG